jgi:nucleoside-diphosphate-sugar epimerase
MTQVQKIRGKKVLITGGLGFIGSNLARKLIGLDCEVTIIDSLDKNCGGNVYNVKDIKDSVKVKIMDINQKSKLGPFVKDKDIVFNLAGQTSHTRSMTNPDSDLKNNVYSHLSLLEACRKINSEVKIIYTGSRSQYGRPVQLPVDEEHAMNPTDINGINKLAAEKYHFLYGSSYGMDVCALRLTNIYGPRHQMKTGDGFINWFVRLAIDGSRIKIFGNGKFLRDALYVADAVDATIMCALSIKSKMQAYNVGKGKPISIRQIAEEIIKICRKGKIDFASFPKENLKIEIGDFYSNINKIKKDIGWEPKTSFKKGIAETVEFYKKNKKHYWIK